MDWKIAYLRAAGIKPNPAGLKLLAEWQPWEGGHTNNDASFNYLNTSMKMPGSHSINDVGIQAFKSLAQGAQAFAKTLRGNSGYIPLVAALRGEPVDPSAGLQMWVSGSPNGNPAYAAKVLGGKAQIAALEPTGATHASLPPLTAPDAGFTPLTQPGVADTVRQQAIAGLGDIAMGKPATDVFAATSEFIQAHPGKLDLKGLAASMPKIEIPTAAQGGDSLDAQAASLVQKYLGVKYTWGGTSAKTGFDCSGLVQTVWKQLGVDIPRTSQEQYKAGKEIPVASLKPGDAVFFAGSDGTMSSPGHEGMYVGGGKFIEAPHTGANVRVSTLAGRTDFVGARRFA